MTKIKWGILGTSFISEVMAKAISSSSSSELYAIGSRSLPQAKKFAEQFSIQKSYDDYHALIQDPNVDVIYIGLPNHLHCEWILHCAKAGKHVLCEKPLVLNQHEAQLIATHVEQANIICMEALMYRYHPLTKKIKTIIDDKMIGDIKLMNATYTANIAAIANPTAGGAIRNLGCYPLSLVRLLANAEPIAMRALGKINSQTKNDNQANLILQFADHSQAMIATADDLEMIWHFNVYGTKGHIELISNPWLPEHENNFLKIYRHHDNQTQELNIIADKPLYTYQIDTMNHAIENNLVTNHEGVSLQDSLQNVAILDAWVREISGVRHKGV